jgi:crotonobetainyl-CoA:carnitine CoA-transferase CaiB-like acyl-CoA transferase
MVVEMKPPPTASSEPGEQGSARRDGAADQAGATDGPPPVRQLGIPVRLSRTPGEHARLPAPALGEHTYQVLQELGYAAPEIAELVRCGAVAGSGEDAKATDSTGAFHG